MSRFLKVFVVLFISIVMLFGLGSKFSYAENFLDKLSKALDAVGGVSEDSKPSGPPIEEQIVRTASTRIQDDVKMGLVEFNVSSTGKESLSEDKQKAIAAKWVEYLEGKILDEVSNKQLFNRIHVIERNSLNSIMEEKKFQVTGLTDKVATEIGGIAGLNVVLIGNAEFSEDSILVRVKMVNVNNGEILGIAKQQMNKKTATLMNDTINLKARYAQSLPLNISRTGELKITVDVLRGNPLDVYLIPANEWQACSNSLTRHQGSFKSYPDFTLYGTKKYSRTATMGPGNYALVIFDKTMGIISQPSSDVKVYAVLTRR